MIEKRILFPEASDLKTLYKREIFVTHIEGFVHRM